MFRLLSWWQGIFSVPGYWMKKLHLNCIWNQLSQYSQNYSSFATTYKSLWVQQHSLSLGEGGFPWILLVRFSQTNVFKSNTKTLNRNKMTWNININCRLNYLSCQGGPKSLYVKFVYFCKTRTVFRVFIISIGDWRILCLLRRIPQLTFSSLWPFFYSDMEPLSNILL